MRRFTQCIVAAAVLFTVAVTPARAWWGYGHETITRGVLQDLNGTGDLQRFIGETDAQFSAIPHIEPEGTHYINIDNTETITGDAGAVSYATDFANFRAHTFTFPTTTSAAYSRYGFGPYILNHGDVPWLANDTLATLTAKMKSATTYADWYHLLPTAGALAHYIEDMHQPLHLTTNYNPGGLHGRYEGGQFEDGSIVRYPELFASMMPVAPTYYGPTSGSGFITQVFNRIPTDYDKIPLLLSADAVAKTAGPAGSVAYYDSLYSQTKAVSEDSFQDAANVIGSALYTAYVNAGSPKIPQAAFYAAPAKEQSTITASGPVGDYTNQDFFTVSQNVYGVARFSTSEIKAQYDARFGPGHWAINNVALTVENQSLYAANSAGTIKVFYSADDSTNIQHGSALRSNDNGAPLGVNTTTDTPLLQYTVAGSESNFSFSRFDSKTPQAFNFSPLQGDILSGNDVTLLLAAASPSVAANYYGGAGLSLEVSARVVPQGDYNGNGTVDAADYTLWRDSLGSKINLAADGNGNGIIDSGDYSVWKSHFGETWAGGNGSTSPTAVPEPSTAVLAFLGAWLVFSLRPSADNGRI